MLHIYINVVCIARNIKALCEGTREFSRSLKLYILDDVESGLVVRFLSLWPSHFVRFSFFLSVFFFFCLGSVSGLVF